MHLVACDLDGTIVRRDGTISPRTLAAFAECEKAGVSIVFATGRPVRRMTSIIEMTGRAGFAVCSNGAVSLDLRSGSIIELQPLTAKVVTESVSRLRSVLPPVIFAVDTLHGYGSEPGYFRDSSPDRMLVVGSLADVLSQDLPVVKLLCRLVPDCPTPVMIADEMLRLARQALADVADPVHSDPAGTKLEISALGISKASQLSKFAHSMKIAKQDIVAFGDMPNDIPMLRWAGRSYAMSGGHPEAIGAADAIAPSCHDDGVAQVLEQILAHRAGSSSHGRP